MLAQHVLGFELPGNAAAALNGLGGVGGEHRGEFPGVLAFLGQPTKPFPGEGKGLGNEIGFLEPALDMAEVDVSVGLDAFARIERKRAWRRRGERTTRGPAVGSFIATISSVGTVRGQDGPGSIEPNRPGTVPGRG